jgi:branched-chain amino acid transport system substrate-binding protein
MLYITPAGGVPRIYERGFTHIFMAAPSGPVEQVKPYFDYIASLPEDQRPTSLAVINDDDFFANFVAIGDMQFAEEKGFEVVNQQTFPPETTDYTPIVESMKAAGADTVVMGTAGAQSAIGVMRASEQLDFSPLSVFQSTGPDQAEYLEALGSLADGAITNVGFHTSAGWPGVQEFIEAFQAKYDGREPFEDNATGYSVGQVLEFAVNNTQSFDNDVLAEFLHTPGLTVMTVQGPIGWLETGFPQGQSLLLQWQDGELEVIWPTGVATADDLWPMPWE